MAFTLTYKSEVKVHCGRRQLPTLQASRGSFEDCLCLGGCLARSFRVLAQRAWLVMRSLLVSLALIGVALTLPAMAADRVELSLDVSKAGA